MQTTQTYLERAGMVKVVEVATNIYVGDLEDGAVKIITDSKVGSAGYIKGWISSYERGNWFTPKEAYEFCRNEPGFAIVGLYPWRR